MSSCRKLDQSIQDALLAASLNEQQAAAIYDRGKEAVVFALLTLTKHLAESQGKPSTLSTPSGMIPTYEKPTAKKRGKKQSGAKQGHAGSRRQIPDKIDWQADHRADNCPECGGRLKRCQETRIRYTKPCSGTRDSFGQRLELIHDLGQFTDP